MKPVKPLGAFLALLLFARAMPAQTGHSSDAVSVDLLRHPIGEKVGLLLRKAMDTMDAGNHEAAIKQLLDILSKHPESAAYVQSLLGVEYFKTGQFRAAVDSLEQAVALLPHNALNHYNLAASLLRNRDLERGEREAERAIELDPDDPTIRALVDALKRAKEHTLQREPAVE
jgi:Flp pilus assembly protein TadD